MWTGLFRQHRISDASFRVFSRFNAPRFIFIFKPQETMISNKENYFKWLNFDYRNGSLGNQYELKTFETNIDKFNKLAGDNTEKINYFYPISYIMFFK